MSSPIFRNRLRGASAFVAAFAALASPLAAEPLTESEAVERALARPEFSALGEANRDGAQARVAGIRSLDNPEATVSRESVSGGGRSETEWQVGDVQPIDLFGKRSRLRAAARAEVGAVEAETARRRQARVGGVIGLWLAGGVLSVATIIGFITLFGIATRNGVMLISHIKHLREAEGVTDLEAAVRRAAEERLVPILMTALPAGLALVPLALAMGEPGSEIQAPMAIVILCGLASWTALNRLVLPAVYLRIAREGFSLPAFRRPLLLKSKGTA